MPVLIWEALGVPDPLLVAHRVMPPAWMLQR